MLVADSGDDALAVVDGHEVAVELRDRFGEAASEEQAVELPYFLGGHGLTHLVLLVLAVDDAGAKRDAGAVGITVGDDLRGMQRQGSGERQTTEGFEMLLVLQRRLQVREFHALHGRNLGFVVQAAEQSLEGVSKILSRFGQHGSGEEAVAGRLAEALQSVEPDESLDQVEAGLLGGAGVGSVPVPEALHGRVHRQGNPR